ncbi:MAG: hypothetical protein IKO72_03840 [Kiritimatiellae bacterium]|nr:hypothetical protein [Kiritimatiellia bacterium]
MNACKVSGPLACLLVCAISAAGAEAVPFGRNYTNQWTPELNAEIDERIEKHRKADGAFDVSAPDGVEVKVEQISSAFQRLL